MATIGDYVKIKHGYAFKGDSISTEDNNIVLVTPGNFSIGGGFKEQKCKYFIGEYPDMYVLKEDDLIVTMTDLSKAVDTLGYSALVPNSDQRTYLHNQRIGLVQILDDRVVKHYLYWFMRTPKYQRMIAATSSGSTVHHTSPDRIYEIEIELPSIDIQKKVAHFLDQIDEKIRVNESINRNLAEQAQLIYKSWFVDYEQFNGIVPVDWEDGTLGDLAEIKTNAFKPDKEPDVMVEHYSIPALDEKHFPVFEIAAGIKSNKYLLTKESVMISKLNPGTKRIWRPLCLSDYPVCSTEFIVFEAYEKAYKDYVYSILDSVKFSNHLCSNVTGSTGSRQRAVPKATLSFEVKIPPQDIVNEFCGILTPIYDLMASNEIEKQRLEEIRNKLLPKLMSGELDVSELAL